MKEEVVFATPWFDLVAKYPPNYDAAHYSIRTLDYVMGLLARMRHDLL